jgi:outer membrane protein
VAAAAQVDVAQAEEDRAGRLLEDARALRAAGIAVRADELGAEARRAAAEVRLIEAQAELANREAELRSLLDVPATTQLVLSDRGSEPPPVRGPVSDLIDEAYADRPELAVLKAQREVVRSRGEVAAAPTRPRVSLVARWDVARPNERYLPLEDEWNTSWSVGLVAGWKVFDGDRTGAEVAALEAEGAALDADLGELQRRVALDVETTQRRLEAAVAAVVAARAAVSAAAAREVDSRDRYTSGIATVAEVLDAQAELAGAETMLAGARSGAWIADAALRRAVGQ